ncbi:MAG: tetratricopeptide repeat protein [Muribaculaceae bacterium]|nr:tetratricopeptide repeat protein [Muribaculaceae bacterium]
MEAADALKRISAEDGTLQQYMDFLNSVDNAPRMDVAEADRLSYEAADKALVTRGEPERMLRYVREYPDGAFRATALESLMAHFAAEGKTDDAVQCAEEIIRRYPDNAAIEQALSVKAEADYAAGRGEAALRAWQQLEQRASSASRLNASRLGIMRVGRDVADYDLVLRAAAALLASSTLGAENRSEAVYSKGLALAASGRDEEAREMWRSISASTDDQYGVKAAYSLAQSYFDDGNLDEAGRLAEELTGSGTPHAYWLARGFILLSDVYSARGKTFEAREYLNALRSNYPGDESDIFDMIDTRLSKLK